MENIYDDELCMYFDGDPLEDLADELGLTEEEVEDLLNDEDMLWLLD